MGSPLSKLYTASLIASDINAYELNVQTYANKIIAIIAYRFMCYSLCTTRDIGEMVIACYEKRLYSYSHAVKYTRVNDASCSLCA